jgi:hypothetical protein
MRLLRRVLLIAATILLTFIGNHLFGLAGAIVGALIGITVVLSAR